VSWLWSVAIFVVVKIGPAHAARGNLVVLGLGKNAELSRALVQLLHKGGDARFDGAE
jgi:hypothetical protein